VIGKSQADYSFSLSPALSITVNDVHVSTLFPYHPLDIFISAPATGDMPSMTHSTWYA